ncbi:Peptidoglycan/xylan/chitin deacetylase, PgdA/CDA1 family [Jannaschia faecimaris]|uniref:Chitooligosaccharide deacetylase n=1 Tax=Jannaschia faecimaris TaxID=1244108 RepID=A0A1H3P761_9RHOB|nr:polysaccharide deacetylase family protein [Jannaschia faecimaris]SDY96645.1 Peptidoglycan/xylan/chitin deacetylase, PgdA/CDA1 family [Jannaschia faecimaris]
MIWDPQAYPWPKGLTAAACFSVDVDATSPHLWQHRRGLPQALAALEHRSYGMRAGLARMVAMLDRIGVRGSFFVPAVVAEENPDLLPGLIERGHEIGLHGYFHELVSDVSDHRFTEALEAAIALFVEQTGMTPSGFRSPAWEMTPHMLRELDRHDLWDSSLMGHDVPYTINGVTQIPVRWDNDDAIFFKFLGAGDKSPRPDREVAEQWRTDADAQIRDGGLFMLTVHDWISGRAARVEMLEHLLRPLVDSPKVWVATCGELAEHHRGLGSGLDVTLDPITPVDEREHPHG